MCPQCTCIHVYVLKYSLHVRSCLPYTHVHSLPPSLPDDRSCLPHSLSLHVFLHFLMNRPPSLPPYCDIHTCTSHTPSLSHSIPDEHVPLNALSVPPSFDSSPPSPLVNIPPLHSHVTGGSGLCWSIVPVTCVAMRWECSAHTVSSLQWLVRSGTGLSVPCTLGGSLTPWLEQSGEVWLSDSLICDHGNQGGGVGSSIFTISCLIRTM